MITTFEHPIPAMLPRPAWRGITVSHFLALGVGLVFYAALVGSPATATTLPIVAQFGPLPSHHDALRSRVVGHPSRFVVNEAQTWVVRLESRDGLPLEHARVGVTTYMPETGQRGVSPFATPTGVRGEYALTGVRFDRAGWWNVALVIRYEAAVDSLAFNLIIK